MKNILFLFLLILIIGCSNKERLQKDFHNNNEDEKVIDTIKYEPIFLNLSPKMDFYEFENKLKENDKILSNGNFSLPIDNEILEFTISKETDRIVLRYSDISSHSISSLDDFSSKFLLEKNNKKIQKFLNLFENKYANNELKNLPFQKNKDDEYINNLTSVRIVNGIKEKKLIDYNLIESNYIIYQDSIKVVAIGYTKKGSYITKNDVINSVDGPGYKDFGVTIEINYFHNSDFKQLYFQIEKDFTEFNDALFTQDSLKNIQEMNVNENKNRI